eukprot:328251-Pelagomonas_calceolata.AAC.1
MPPLTPDPCGPPVANPHFPPPFSLFSPPPAPVNPLPPAPIAPSAPPPVNLQPPPLPPWPKRTLPFLPCAEQEVEEADFVLRLAPREPWEEANADAADPLGAGQKLPTVVTRLTVSVGEGATVHDPGADVLHDAFPGVPEWQVRLSAPCFTCLPGLLLDEQDLLLQEV